ncbi:hypothetical protein ABRP64_11320 [Corynebacterium sp. KPL4015]|jgi:hypothetical protein|uniref:hypothetical protein n=1 Tax=Corynebacterium sp. KPL4015 TaxID=3158326 RepID=UPI0032EBA434
MHTSHSWLKRTCTKRAMIACVALSMVGGNAYATAAETNSPDFTAAEVNSEPTSAQEAQLADDLEVLFTEYIPQKDGVFTVNEQAVIRDGYADSMGDFHAVARAFNSPNPGHPQAGSKTPVMVQTYDANSYAKCVLWSALGIPATAFTSGTWSAIVTGIKAFNWKLTASTIVRALGPAFVNGAGKAIGGPATIAAALAASAGLCAFQQ